jgi:hypothetical protein
MESIISCYFTSARDTQGREPIKQNDIDYIKTWYDSVIALDLQCVLFHDGFTQEFMDSFPKMRFMRVPPIPRGVQLYDYRWPIYHTYLHRHDDIENVFFTDASDVKVVKNPFTQPEYDKNTLYCGDEPERLNESKFMQVSLKDAELQKLDGFKDIITSDAVIYNAGVIGGSRLKVLEFTEKMSALMGVIENRVIDGTVDMPSFNYILHRYFKPVHGFPVNSVFKAYEDRNDVWFIHK